jgi:hypothetical protein
MTSAWSSTVAVLSGNVMPPPTQWPASRTRRIELWEKPVPRPLSTDVTDAERAVLAAVMERPRNGGEVAYALGIDLEAAYARISRLRSRGFLAKNGLAWECTHAGREALQCFDLVS